MESTDIPQIIMKIQPMWHYRIVKPFKQLLDDGISPETYYCLNILRNHEGMLTMSEIAQLVHMPKQQMTKIVNRLIEKQFVERIYDPSDRRIIRLRVTEQALYYMNRFAEHKTSYYEQLVQQIKYYQSAWIHLSIQKECAHCHLCMR